MYYFKKEYFIINNNTPEAEKKQVLKTFDETGEVLNFNLNEIDITSPLIDAYLDEKILDKKSNQSTNNNDLPFMRDNNLTNYNHQLKLLINSRKISQNIILNIIRNKINYLMGSLKNIKDVKKKYPSLV
jgi:hypothetical protein